MIVFKPNSKNTVIMTSVSGIQQIIIAKNRVAIKKVFRNAIKQLFMDTNTLNNAR